MTHLLRSHVVSGKQPSGENLQNGGGADVSPSHPVWPTDTAAFISRANHSHPISPCLPACCFSLHADADREKMKARLCGLGIPLARGVTCFLSCQVTATAARALLQLGGAVLSGLI